MLNDLSRTLQKLGLREKEARVYLCCLANRNGLYAHEIVKQTGINRSTIDVLVARLLNLQWLGKVKVGNRYKYQARDIKSIHAQKQEILGNLEKLFPLIDRINIDLSQTELKFYEGAKGIEQLYHELAAAMKRHKNPDDPLYHIAASTNITKVFPGYIQFVEQRIKLGIPVRILAPEQKNDRIWIDDPAEFRQVKIFNGNIYQFGINFDIYLDTVYICSPSKPVAGFAIQNGQIANSFKELFRLIWDLLPAKK